MTWLRFDCEMSRSDVVGFLAHELALKPAQALGHYTAVALGFGEFQPDGMVAGVSDTTIEEWALWRGKRGAFAAVFRARCVSDGSNGRDPSGRIRGWWRQDALIRKQQRDASRPPSRDRPPNVPLNSPEKPAGETRGKIDGDVDDDEDGTASSSSTARAREPARNTRLEERLQGNPLAPAIFAFLDQLPERESRVTWTSILAGCLDGMGTAQGRAATVAELAAACTDFVVEQPERWKPNHFRAFVDKAISRMRREAPSGHAVPNGTPKKGGFARAAERARAQEAAKGHA